MRRPLVLLLGLALLLELVVPAAALPARADETILLPIAPISQQRTPTGPGDNDTGLFDCQPAAVAMALGYLQSQGAFGGPALSYEAVRRAYRARVGGNVAIDPHNAPAIVAQLTGGAVVGTADWLPPGTDALAWLRAQLSAGLPPSPIIFDWSLLSPPGHPTAEAGAKAGFAHSVLVIGISDHEVTYNDPWDGRTWSLPRDLFLRAWLGPGGTNVAAISFSLAGSPGVSLPPGTPAPSTPTPLPLPTPTSTPAPTDPAPGAWKLLPGVGPGTTGDPPGGAPVAFLPDKRALVLWSKGATGMASVFNPDRRTWTSLKAPPVSCDFATCTVAALPAGILVAGGLTASGVETKAAFFFDGTSWHDLPPMPRLRSGALAVTLDSGQVLVLGGYGAVDPLASSDVFDPVTLGWRQGPDLPFIPTAAKRLPGGGALAISMDGQAARYDPDSDRWRRLGQVTTSGSDGDLAPLADGAVALAGAKPGQDFATVDPSSSRFSASDNRWTDGPDYPGDFCPATVLLSDGRLFAAGGFAGGSDFNPGEAAELLDRDVSHWKPVAPVPWPIGCGSAEELDDGTVLVIALAADFTSSNPSDEVDEARAFVYRP